MILSDASTHSPDPTKGGARFHRKLVERGQLTNVNISIGMSIKV